MNRPSGRVVSRGTKNSIPVFGLSLRVDDIYALQISVFGIRINISVMNHIVCNFVNCPKVKNNN
jgi:hypothetical protein